MLPRCEFEDFVLFLPDTLCHIFPHAVRVSYNAPPTSTREQQTRIDEVQGQFLLGKIAALEKAHPNSIFRVYPQYLKSEETGVGSRDRSLYMFYGEVEDLKDYASVSGKFIKRIWTRGLKTSSPPPPFAS
jgi:hypothetical protein